MEENHDNIEDFLRARLIWLRNEMHSGGNWEHLKIRLDECSYIFQKLFRDKVVED